jgi:lipoprotein-releasing system ATP-binding protein
MLKAVDIFKSYGSLQVLKGVSLELHEGEVVALVGSSGAGKSTLLQILGTLDLPDKGEIFFRDEAILPLSASQKAQFRNESLGFVFQFHHLLPEFTALENVCIPAFIQGKGKAESLARGRDLLAQLGLAARADHKPSQLSGGEQQRVSIARALINQPRLILADEPTGNLDTHTSQDLYRLIFELAQETGVGFLIVTHNQELAAKADRQYHIKDGMM